MSDLSPQARRVLQLTREALSPDESAVSALRAALEARLGVGDLPSALPASSAEIPRAGAVAISKSALLKLAVVVLIGGVGLFWFALEGRTGQPSAAERAAPAKRPPPSAAAPARVITASEPMDSRLVEVAASVPSAETSPPRPSIGDSALRSTHRLHPSQRIAHNAVRSSNVTQPVPVRVTNSASSSVPEDDDSLAPELALLREARTALDRHDPSTALTVLDRHDQRYPAGILRQESLAVRALALCALGRAAAASAAARELARIAPGSPYLARVPARCNAEQSK